MFVPVSLSIGRITARPLPAHCRSLALVRWLHSDSDTPSYDLRYAHKLQQKAKEKGLDLDELKAQARESVRRKQKEEAVPLLASFKNVQGPPQVTPQSDSPTAPGTAATRKDSSPVKPLSSILNVPRLLATPHTSSQISALWTAYHASRTGGTGKGFLCASLPVESYNTMLSIAKKYPVFVVPVPRESTPDTSPDPNSSSQAHEFYFLHSFRPGSRPIPTCASGSSSNLPHVTTVLFTPLQEYKLRTSFATPYLVLTFYPDLAQSHGTVLLRGEITPSPISAAAQPGLETSKRFVLSQIDAQLLTMAVQRFYLWGEGRKDGGDQASVPEKLLKQFHEKPEEFDWQDLLEHSKVTA
ncbi:ATP11-domain-containing protein [Melanogaster broomeanus]|nr:ATP11-domain-containing protein [Melanogaster broomeanus]